MGRDTKIVAAACLYMACRIHQYPLLLIDFSDAIQMDMYKIAEVFKIFSNDTLLDPKDKELMVMDPSIYIHRYCDRLEFPDENVVKKVRDIAIRLI